MQIYEGAPRYSLMNNERGMLTVLRSRTKADFARLSGMEKGMEQLLYDAAQDAETMTEFFALAKTKRYSLARLRRLAFCSFLHIPAELSTARPPYIRLLGMNERGEELLSHADFSLPVSASLARLEKESAAAGAFAAAEARSWELDRLFADRPVPRGAEYTTPVFKQRRA